MMARSTLDRDIRREDAWKRSAGNGIACTSTWYGAAEGAVNWRWGVGVRGWGLGRPAEGGVAAAFPAIVGGQPVRPRIRFRRGAEDRYREFDSGSPARTDPSS